MTDFGLVLDRHFSLREDEIAFFNLHQYYDYGEVISNLIFPMYDAYHALPESNQNQLQAQYGISKEGDQFFQTMLILTKNAEDIMAQGLIQMNETYLNCFFNYRRIFLLLGQFFADLSSNQQKNTPFPHEELQGLLQDVNIV